MLRGYGNRIRRVNPVRKIFSTRDKSDSFIYGRALSLTLANLCGVGERVFDAAPNMARNFYAVSARP